VILKQILDRGKLLEEEIQRNYILNRTRETSSSSSSSSSSSVSHRNESEESEEKQFVNGYPTLKQIQNLYYLKIYKLPIILQNENKLNYRLSKGEEWREKTFNFFEKIKHLNNSGKREEIEIGEYPTIQEATVLLRQVEKYLFSLAPLSLCSSLYFSLTLTCFCFNLFMVLYVYI